MTEQMTTLDHIPHKAEWVAALRSGAYKQTHGTLHNKSVDGYCCLGVWCKVAGHALTDNGLSVMVDGRDAGYEPIHRAMGKTADGSSVTSLFYRLNDSYGRTFGEIADFIEGKVSFDELVNRCTELGPCEGNK